MVRQERRAATDCPHLQIPSAQAFFNLTNISLSLMSRSARWTAGSSSDTYASSSAEDVSCDLGVYDAGMVSDRADAEDAH